MSTDNDPPPPYSTRDPLATAPPSQAASPIFYHIFRSHFGNYKVDQDDKRPAFYIATRSLRKPNLIVHRGNGEIDKVVAHCVYPELGTIYKIGLFATQNDKSSIAWTKMTSDWRFEAVVRVPDITRMSATVSAKRIFLWKRTPNLTLVDEETGLETAVVHVAGISSRKCCVLEIRERYGAAFDLLVVTSTIAIYEKERKSSSEQPIRITGRGPAGAQTAGFSGAFSG
ncbi:hypothetical protein OIDMADRAFT_20652 [Oidiodendron maius Zn]|uniref:Uncharacterized protein n=1 Tax=Oidiodendron maius (strain Zn) TaxID=913774 RepID=A0A0C3H2P8_OIDMZ|nr:hypothetical protein OIDMADRAFT_20652 [Oidiodendron maius Zn]